jgi:hypothetical protein
MKDRLSLSLKNSTSIGGLKNGAGGFLNILYFQCPAMGVIFSRFHAGLPSKANQEDPDDENLPFNQYMRYQCELDQRVLFQSCHP